MGEDKCLAHLDALELRITQGNCDVAEMSILPCGRMALMRETELPCRETATCLINLSWQNVPTLSPLMECKGKTNEESSKELYPKINPFRTLLQEEPQERLAPSEAWEWTL